MLLQHFIRLSALAVLSAAVTAAPAGAAVVDEVAVKVNNEAVMRSEYNQTKDLLIEQYRAAMPDFFKAKDAGAQLEKAAMDKLVDEALLRQQAETLKIKIYDRELDNGIAEIKKRFSRSETGAPLSGPAADKAFRDELKKENVTPEQFRSKIQKQLMVRKLVEDTVRTRASLPKEAEVKAYFEKITLAVKSDTAAFAGMNEEATQDLMAVAQRFKEFTSERVRVRHILFKFEETAPLTEKNQALKKAEDAKKELDRGADFEDLAARYSEDKESAQKGGDLGYIVKGMLPRELEEPAFALPLGEASNPVLTQFGYHLLRVDEKRIAQKLKFDQVKDDLEQLLAQANFARELANYLKELRKGAKIEVFTGQNK
ncbi:MAG: peptidylprolyl isomerase [Elusimicrobia bacterium]|nr:peptidylprolyl isomerase [Elusimicrobiota bacterium]